MSNKVRIFLLVLTLSFIATAVTINSTINNKEVLDLDSRILTEKIHEKESVIDDIFNNELLLKTFANSERYPLQVREITKKYQDQSVYLYIYKKNEPIFWSLNLYVPESLNGLKNEISYISVENRSFIVKKKEINDEITILALLIVKRLYKNSDNYLKPVVLQGIPYTNNLEVADFSDDQNIKNIYSKNNTYLFSVKLSGDTKDGVFIKIQLLCWFLATLSFVTLIMGVCIDIAKKGRAGLSILLLAMMLFLLRFFDYHINWLSENSSFTIFRPENYSYPPFTPNLRSFIANSVAILLFICHCIYVKNELRVPKKFKGKPYGIIFFYILLCLLYIVYNQIFHYLGTMVTHSSITDYNFIEILQTYSFSPYLILIYCINILSLILLTDFVLYLGKKLCDNIQFTINIQLIVLIQFLIIAAWNNEFIFVNVLIGLIVLVRALDNSMFRENNISTHVISLVALAFITAIVFSQFYKSSQEQQLKQTITLLKSNDDPEAIVQFDSVEKDILKDDYISKILQFTYPAIDGKYLTSYIKRKYLNGYLSKYDFQGYYYLNDQPVESYNSNKINDYREKVINSTKVNSSSSFYKYSTEIGTLEYFAVIKIPLASENEFTMIFNFTNKAFNQVLPFPIILNADKNEQQLNQKNLSEDSYAFFKNGTLITQNGKYVYPSTDASLPQKVGEYITLNDDPRFIHMLYRPNSYTTIIVSKEAQSYWEFIALASSSFLLLYVVTTLINMCLALIPVFFVQNLSFRTLMSRLSRIKQNIRYSTRIQTLVISSVLLAVIISGLITFISISYQSEENRKNEKIEFISKITHRIESNISNSSYQEILTNIEDLIKSTSNVLTTDFNLYNNNGKLIYSTQPKIYDQRLISSYIHMDALLNLNVLKKNGILNKEILAGFRYDVTYATIRNANYQTLAYLSIPYFASNEEETSSQNVLLNTILNIYTIIVIIFAFLSAFIARKITEPLQLVGKKLAETNLSSKPNEPLYWDKNDEIGSLIKEYNYMLVKLEENAVQLRNKEREAAWREMAQQVAHEIKNPLTPMKLGIQQLSRSFHENDPNLEERFKKISTSFIEQIDALSHIASEFSSFAKLPETKMIVIDLIEKITKSIDTYSSNPNVYISIHNRTKLPKVKVLGDRGQLLRTFNNLIKNAIEAGSKRRKLKINIIISTLGDDMLEIQVMDNGLGISEEARPNIFRPNFTTKSSGTGLGLAFVKQTIEGMNGRIRFESSTNIGTTFFIYIPRYEDEQSIS